MRAVAVCCPVVLLASVAANFCAAQAPEKGPADLQGTWTLVSLEVEGKARDPFRGEPAWVIRGNKVTRAGEPLAVLTVHPGAAPRAIDLKLLRSSRVYEGVYAVDGGTLKVCVNVQADGVKERPLELSTQDKPGRRMLVFRRVEAGEGGEKEEVAGFVGIAIRLDKDKKRVVIADVLKDSPAQKADLKKDDVILRIGGQEAGGLQETIEAVRQNRPGTTLTIRVRRGRQERDVTVRAGVVPFFLLD